MQSLVGFAFMIVSHVVFVAKRTIVYIIWRGVGKLFFIWLGTNTNNDRTQLRLPFFRAEVLLPNTQEERLGPRQRELQRRQLPRDSASREWPVCWYWLHWISLRAENDSSVPALSVMEAQNTVCELSCASFNGVLCLCVCLSLSEGLEKHLLFDPNVLAEHC